MEYYVDQTCRTVYKGHEAIALTRKEFAILMLLMHNRGKPLDVVTIYEQVWEEQYLPSSQNTVMVHILHLRKKLEDDPARPRLIRTVWGRGYQMDA